MKRTPTNKLLLSAILALPFFVLASCSKNPPEGKLIITLAPASAETANFVDGTVWRLAEGARLASIDRNEPSKGIKILTESFSSACSPDISYDGKSMLFSGKLKKEDPWSIWEMNLSNLKFRKISPEGNNCADPVYLPANRFAFSMAVQKDSLLAGHSLYTGNLDGTNIQRITFNPASFLASNTLADGRIISSGRRIYPDTGAQRLMVMRPDGTKAELFYMPGNNGTVCSRIRETADGKVVFIESSKGTGDDGNLVSVNYSRPLHSYKNLSAGIQGNIISVLPEKPGNYLVCYRKSSTDRYALCEFDAAKNTLIQTVFEDKELNIIDAVADAVHTRPRKLPSEVDMKVKTGLLMCQDINFLDPSDKSANKIKASKIELLGIGKSLGIVDVEADGSFYIKPIADTPFRIQTLDEKGKVINGPGSWLYLRPNERRGCVGCHEDMETTPENRLALAIAKKPVIVPVHIVKIKEKKVDLE
jgi:hypothetical protein